jgi:hypothetical protein
MPSREGPGKPIETRPRAKPEGGGIVRFPRKTRPDGFHEGKQEGNVVPLSHVDEKHANGRYFPMAESADGELFWHSGGDGYVVFNHPEKYGLKPNTEGSRYSLYLQRPDKDFPKDLLQKALDFLSDIHDLEQVREHGRTYRQMDEERKKQDVQTKQRIPERYKDAWERVRKGNIFIERLAKEAITLEEKATDFAPSFDNDKVLGWNDRDKGIIEDLIAKGEAEILRDEPFSLAGVISGTGFFSSRHIEYRLPSGEVRHAYIFDKSMEGNYARESIIAKSELSSEEVWNIRNEVNEQSSRHFDEHQNKQEQIADKAPTRREHSLIWGVGNIARNKKFQEGALQIAKSGIVPEGTFLDVYNDHYKPIMLESALLWVKIKHPEIKFDPGPSRSPGEGE